MKRKTAHILDIAGTVLVLVALCWEFHFERTLNSLQDDARQYRIERKLDEIWGLLGHEFTQDQSNRTQTSTWFGYDSAAKSWEYAEERNSGLEKQINVFSGIRFSFFALGSFLLLWGKIAQMQKEITDEPV